ncbi:MAG: amidohydrolase family protein [Clostridia bacterium]|nr:amidohydrolase family protein [Clostridia bacterium]
MYGYQKDSYDLKVYSEELRDFLPDNIVDAHAHIWRVEDDEYDRSKFPKKWTNRVAGECPIEDLLQTYQDFFEGKKVIPVIFGNSVARAIEHNEYVKSVIKKYNFPALYWTRYDMSAEFLEENVLLGGFSGLKPYLGGCKAGVVPAEADIFDFLPKSHLALADKLGLKVVLHLSKSKRLKDKSNLSQLLEIEEKYPNVKLIVAHVGRAYADEDVGNAFEVLKNTKNMIFDFSANTNSSVITRCIETVGVKRVLFGTDLPIAKMKMKRVVENGNYINVIPRGLYGDVSNDSHMRETDDKNVTNFTYEILRAFKKSATDLTLTKKDIEDIMCGNACNLYNIKF